MISPRLLIVLFAVLTVCLAASGRNDLIVGHRVVGDRLICRESVQKDASFLGTVKVKKTFTGNGYSNITMIKALDQHTNGYGATAVILGGGVGFKYVTIEFQSQLFRSIDFIVEIYGR